jgi:LacI family transcriptional regulator
MSPPDWLFLTIGQFYARIETERNVSLCGGDRMATIKDVARITGLSLATISKYLNGGHVLDANRTTIEQAIADLGYSVNKMARGLKTSRSMTVGVLIPDLENVFITSIISNFENILHHAGYSTIICDYKHDAGLEQAKLDFLASRQIDGLVMMPLSGCRDSIQQLQNRKIPVVLIDRPVAGIDCDAVLVRNEQASFAAVSTLIQAGHRRIGVICGPPGVYTADERLRGYTRALTEHGLVVDPRLIRHGHYDTDSGYQLTSELMQAEPQPELGPETRPTALFVTNHEMTLGAVLALHAMRIKIPDQLSIVGFDNQMLATVHQPILATVVQPLRLIGEYAARLMLDRMGGDLSGFPVVYQLETTWLPGASIAQVGE